MYYLKFCKLPHFIRLYFEKGFQQCGKLSVHVYIKVLKVWLMVFFASQRKSFGWKDWNLKVSFILCGWKDSIEQKTFFMASEMGKVCFRWSLRRVHCDISGFRTYAQFILIFPIQDGRSFRTMMERSSAKFPVFHMCQH